MNTKMRYCVLDPGYRDPGHLGLGATWLRWALERAGVVLETPERADVWLVSVQSQQSKPKLKTLLRRHGFNPKRQRLVLGGPGCYAPAVFDDLAHLCCVGEGPEFLRSLLTEGWEAAAALPYAWVPGETREVIPASEFPWDLPPIRFQDGFVRVWATRGCRRRCLFCQTGWECCYRRNPHWSQMVAAAQQLAAEGERICVSTNDAADVDWTGLPIAQHMSATFEGVQRLVASGYQLRGQVRSVRLGVEGVSERLRQAVGKPVPNEALVELTGRILAQGVGVTWFFIVGLPGEAEVDYDDLRELTLRVKRTIPKGSIMCRFHAFIPQPAAPLSLLPLRDDYWTWFDEWRRWFFHGPGLTRRIQIIAPSRPPHRLKDARLSMACDEARLRRGWADADPPNWRVRYQGTAQHRRAVARRYMERLQG